MSVALLDVNVLVALAWPSHIQHGLAHRWFVRNAGGGMGDVSHHSVWARAHHNRTLEYRRSPLHLATRFDSCAR